jgi:hypothetical protein
MILGGGYHYGNGTGSKRRAKEIKERFFRAGKGLPE